MGRLIALFGVAALAFSGIVVSFCRADEVTQERVSKLPVAEQEVWKQYLEQSQATAQADADALQAEVAAAGLSIALQAPTGGDFKLSHKLGDPWYAGDEAQAMADIVLSYQAPSGGWSKHTGYTRRTPSARHAMVIAIRAGA